MFEGIRNFFGGKKINPNDIQAVINAYGKVLSEGSTLLRDCSELPLTKEQIKVALKKAIELTPESKAREQLKNSYVMLGDFQNLKECTSQNIDPSERMLSEAKTLLAEVQTL